MNKKKTLWIPFIVCIILCLMIQVVGSFWTKQTISTWYPTLKKPSWTPPNSLFGPVWSVLYLMIGMSGLLIYRAKPSLNRTLALIVYGNQLAANFLWSFLFFSLRSPALALFDIVLLSLLILLTIITSYRVDRLASLLLIPYFLWVIYATALNGAIYSMNVH